MRTGELPRLLTLAAWLAGWALLTAGVAACLRPEFVAATWLLSSGALLLGLGGYRLFVALLWHGVLGAQDADTKLRVG